MSQANNLGDFFDELGDFLENDCWEFCDDDGINVLMTEFHGYLGGGLSCFVRAGDPIEKHSSVRFEFYSGEGLDIRTGFTTEFRSLTQVKHMIELAKKFGAMFDSYEEEFLARTGRLFIEKLQKLRSDSEAWFFSHGTEFTGELTSSEKGRIHPQLLSHIEKNAYGKEFLGLEFIELSGAYAVAICYKDTNGDESEFRLLPNALCYSRWEAYARKGGIFEDYP